MAVAPELKDLAGAPEGELQLEAELGACFSNAARRVLLRWTATDATLQLGASEPVAIDRAHALAVVARIVGAAARAEVWGGGRTTTVHTAKLAWSAGGARGERTWWTNDVRYRDVREAVARVAGYASKVVPDAYAPAIALYDLAGAILRERA